MTLEGSDAAADALPPLPSPSRSIGRGRRIAGALLATAGLCLLTAALLPLRETLSLPSHLLLFLLGVVVVSLVGGVWPGLLAAVVASLLLNWFFTPPYNTFDIAQHDHVLALIVFVLVAAAVSVSVEIAGRLAAVAARSAAETRVVAELTRGLPDEAGLEEVLDRTLRTFRLEQVTLQERMGSRWEDVATRGSIGDSPNGNDVRLAGVPDNPLLRLRLIGPPLFAEDRRVLDSFAAAAARAYETSRLAAGDRMRTALLAAVGHDLRTPLSGIKAAVSSLRQSDVDWSPQEQAELLATIEESTDQLAALIADLLDLSRLQAGVVHPAVSAVGLDEVVATALHSVGSPAVDVDVAEDLPDARADAALLARVVANLVSNACRHAPGSVVTVRGSANGDNVQLAVVDHGPGIPAQARDALFAPFQRLGDARRDEGLGLGLAVARGLTQAMGGRLEPSDTPGGGLTMTVSLPTARPVGRPT